MTLVERASRSQTKAEKAGMASCLVIVEERFLKKEQATIEDEKPRTSVNNVVSLTQHPEIKITCMDEYEYQKVSF